VYQLDPVSPKLYRSDKLQKRIGDNTEPCLTPKRTANISEYVAYNSILFKKSSDIYHSISTKLCNCMMIEEVRAIILSSSLFWIPSVVLPLGVIENLAENAPTE